MRSQAPHRYGENKSGESKDLLLTGNTPPSVTRPTFLEREEAKTQRQSSTTTGTPSPGVRPGESLGREHEEHGHLRTPPIVEEQVEQEQLALTNGGEGEERQDEYLDEGELQVALRQGDQLVPRASEALFPRPFMSPQPEPVHVHDPGHQGVQYGMDPTAVMQQQMLTLFEALRQENRDLRDELRDQRRGFETQVKALQKEIENQAFRTPDSHPGGESRSGEERLPATTTVEQERKRLYKLTPMQQFKQMQSIMVQTTPMMGRGNRGRTARERSRSGGPQPGDGRRSTTTTRLGPMAPTSSATRGSMIGTGKGATNPSKRRGSADASAGTKTQEASQMR